MPSKKVGEMTKQISISDELTTFLDHFRDKWGKNKELSYTKAIKRFIGLSTEEDLDRFAIVSTFDKLNSELPTSYFLLIEYTKALILKAQLKGKQDEAAKAIQKLLNFKELWEEHMIDPEEKKKSEPEPEQNPKIKVLEKEKATLESWIENLENDKDHDNSRAISQHKNELESVKKQLLSLEEEGKLDDKKT